jgi:HSP20 family protein
MKKDLIKKTDSESGLVLIDRFNDIIAEFDGIFTRFGSLFDKNFIPVIEDLKAPRFPKVNMLDTLDSYEIEIAVAGFDKEDVALELKGNSLFVTAEKKEECCDEKEGKRYLCKEIAYRSFKRVLPFPVEVDPDSVSAKYENGVIKCRVSKIQAEKPTSVKIEITD